MRLVHWIVTLPVAIVLATFAVSNRAMVDLTFWPLPYDLAAPLYLITLLMVVVGFLLGLLLGWLGSQPVRRERRRQRKRIVELEAELARLRVKPEPAVVSNLPAPGPVPNLRSPAA